jgi:hypothetical protein
MTPPGAITVIAATAILIELGNIYRDHRLTSAQTKIARTLETKSGHRVLDLAQLPVKPGTSERNIPVWFKGRIEYRAVFITLRGEPTWLTTSTSNRSA